MADINMPRIVLYVHEPNLAVDKFGKNLLGRSHPVKLEPMKSQFFEQNMELHESLSTDLNQCDEEGISNLKNFENKTRMEVCSFFVIIFFCLCILIVPVS